MHPTFLRLFLAVFAMAIAIALCSHIMSADGQTPKTTGWDYKVIAVRGVERDDAPAHEKTLDELAKDGWEYVGLLTQHLGYSTVVFKRPK